MLSCSRRLQVETLRPSYLFKVVDSLALGDFPRRSHLKASRRCQYHIIVDYNNEHGGFARIPQSLHSRLTLPRRAPYIHRIIFELEITRGSSHMHLQIRCRYL